MQDTKSGHICKQCLLREFDEQAYLEKLDRVIKLMDDDTKAEEALYEKRLSVCKKCEKLFQGTCTGCGCYVELRAAVKKNRCPYKYW